MNTSNPTCEQCGQPISMDPRAPHKRFCGVNCKAAYWRRARKAGAAALDAAKGAA